MKKNPMVDYDELIDYCTDFNKMKQNKIDDNPWKKDLDTSGLPKTPEDDTYSLYGGWIDPTWVDWKRVRELEDEKDRNFKKETKGIFVDVDQKCDCGSWKVHGENYNKHLHSTWCSISFKLK